MTTPVTSGTLPWRSMEELPSEILNVVFDLLRQDKRSHWKLALLNRKFNAHFTPLLYRSVELFSYDQMHRFVRYASDRSSVSPARRAAVTQELLIAPPPRPCPYFAEAYHENTSRAQLSPRQFNYLALGYDIETAAALGGGYSSLDPVPERDDPSMFGCGDIPGLLPEDAPKARVTMIPVRNDDRCFLVMSEVLRICPDVESLHFDIGTFEIYADEYRLPDDSFVDVDGVEKTRWNYLPQGLLPYLHCEGHRLIAAFGGLQRLKHFSWTHCQERNWTIERWGSRQDWQAWFIYARRMDVLTYGFDAMARRQAGRGAHPLETIRLHTPSCEHWDKGAVPSHPTWYPSACDRRSYHQRLPVYVYDDDPWSRESRTKTFPQVVLGFGTHGETQVNRLNFPSLREVTLVKPSDHLPPEDLASILCQNPSKARLRVAAWNYGDMEEHDRKAVLAGRAEHPMAFYLVLALQAHMERALALLPKICGPVRKRARLQRDRDIHSDDQRSTRPASNPVFRLFGHPRWDWLERSLARMRDGSDEDVKIRESLMMAAILEKLCRGSGRAGADDDSTTKTTPRAKKTPLHPPSKPLWSLLSRIYLAARPLPTSDENSKARAELQCAVAKSLIETADEEARRDLQTVRFTFNGVPEATTSLAQLEECFKAMADVLAETMPVWLPGSQEAEAHDEASGRGNSSCAVSSSWTDSQRLCGVELAQLRLPFGPSFIKRRLVRLAQASSQDAARDDRDYYMSIEEYYNRKPAAPPLRCWLNLEELKLWDLDPMEAIVDLDDEDLDWTPAALKETLAAEGGQDGYDSDERNGRDFPPAVTYRPSTPEPEWVPQFYFDE